LWLPISVFILSGIIDTSLNYFNAIFEDDPSFVFFPVLVFFTAGIVGLFYSIFFDKSGNKWKLKSFIGGVYLGIPNFFSLFFLLETLKIFNQDGAFIFPFTNLGTILLSALGAFILFKEKLHKLQLMGIVLAIISLFLLAYQEFLSYF
jgi:drug/metabolite transporter (DMT)-like permease